MSRSDSVLIERWSQFQDAEAFAELVRRHASMVHGTCLRILGNGADAEEVAQDCFLELLRQASEAGYLNCPKAPNPHY